MPLQKLYELIILIEDINLKVDDLRVDISQKLEDLKEGQNKIDVKLEELKLRITSLERKVRLAWLTSEL